MYLSFDAFLLYKTYGICGGKPLIYRLCVSLIIFRAFWSVWDIIESHGFWDPVGTECIYYQYPITGLGYNGSDIAIDLFCTIVSIAYTRSHLLGPNYGGIGRVIFKENSLRSLITVSINVYLLYASWVLTDPFALWFGYLTQDFVYATCLNLDQIAAASASLPFAPLLSPGLASLDSPPPSRALDSESVAEGPSLSRTIPMDEASADNNDNDDEDFDMEEYLAICAAARRFDETYEEPISHSKRGLNLHCAEVLVSNFDQLKDGDEFGSVMISGSAYPMYPNGEMDMHITCPASQIDDFPRSIHPTLC
ncbi:hypothetical protein HDU98_009699 [Podochytrium sp. JEL0797]|nr:hypothetical protein HDU98_009699 [Podochytrium sp. JEL0797]